MRIPSGVTDQYIFFVAVDATDLETRETGLTGFTVYRARDNGAATAMTTPTVTELSAANMPGVYKLLLNEDMTIGAGNDSEEMVFHITQASMAPVTRTIELYRPKITAGNTLGVAADGDISGDVDGNVVGSVASVTGAVGSVTGAVGSVTAAVTLPTIPANWITAAGINASAMNGKGDWNIGKTGYSISGIITTLDGLNNVAATDIVSAGAITTLSGAVVNVDTVDTCTTNTDMRGTDNALLAANVPTNFTDLAITVTTGRVDVNVNNDKAGYSISGTKTTLDSLNDITAANVNAEVVDALTVDTYAEPGQGTPAATASLKDKIGYIFKCLRNRKTATASQISIYNDDATTVDHKRTISDNGTTYDEGELTTGP